MNEQEQPRRRRRRLCRTSADWFGLAAMVLLMICSLVLLVQLIQELGTRIANRTDKRIR